MKQAIKAQRGVEVQPCSFFKLVARIRRVVNATPQPIYPWET
jgi:hypothetical protein